MVLKILSKAAVFAALGILIGPSSWGAVSISKMSFACVYADTIMSADDPKPKTLSSGLASLTPASQEKWETFSALYRARQKEAATEKASLARLGCAECSLKDMSHKNVTRTLVIGAHHIAAMEAKDVYDTLANPVRMYSVVEKFTKGHGVPKSLSLHFTYAMGRAAPMDALKLCLTYVLLSYENPSIMLDFSQFQWLVAQKMSDSSLDGLSDNELKERLHALCGHSPWQNSVVSRRAAMKGDMGALYPAWKLKWKLTVKEPLK